MVDSNVIGRRTFLRLAKHSHPCHKPRPSQRLKVSGARPEIEAVIGGWPCFAVAPCLSTERSHTVRKLERVGPQHRGAGPFLPALTRRLAPV